MRTDFNAKTAKTAKSAKEGMSAQWQDRAVWFCLAIFVVFGLGAVMPNTVVQMMTYDSVADMAANANPASYVFRSAYTRGYYAPGDGGGGHFFPTNSVTSTNLGTRIKALVASGWSWDLVDKTRVSVLQFGFKGDDATDNSAALTSLITALGPGVEVIWPNGTYRVNSTQTITKSNFTWKASAPQGAKIKFTPASKQATGMFMQGDGWKFDGLEIDWQQNAAQGLYCDNAHHGWTIQGNCYIHGAYADHSNDPSDTTEVANVTVRRGNYDWTITDSDLSGADCAAAGTRTAAGLTVTDFGRATSADNNYNGLIRRVKFTAIGPGVFGDGIRFNMTQAYDSRHKVIDCDFGDIGFRGVKLIGNGIIVRGNTFANTDTNARAAIENFGDNNVIEGNSIAGYYAYGIAGGSTLGATVRHGRYAGNIVRFTGGATTTGIGFRFTDEVGSSVIVGNTVTDASYGLLADGRFNGNSIDGLAVTNIVNSAVSFATTGGNAPDRCQVNNVVCETVGNYGVQFTAGSNLDCGLVTGTAAGNEVFYGAGVSGKLAGKIYGDGLWRDWNGVPMQGNGWIWDECISPTLAGSIGWTTSTLNSGTAAVSSILDANHCGVYAVSNGGTTNGVGNIRNNGGNILLGTRTIRYVTCVKTPPASSTADRYQIFAGFGDATTAASVDGAFFTYSDNLNSGNWTGQTMAASATTTASGGSNVAVTGSAYWWLGIEANSSSCKFYVAADSSGAPGAWTLIGSSSANLPTSGPTGLLHMMIKQAGSTGTTTDTFYMEKVGYQP